MRKIRIVSEGSVPRTKVYDAETGQKIGLITFLSFDFVADLDEGAGVDCFATIDGKDTKLDVVEFTYRRV